MHLLTLPADRVTFPAYCVECGAAPTRTFRLSSGHARFAAPLCARCSERKGVGQFVWIVACVAAGVGVAVLAAVGADALLPAPMSPALAAVVFTAIPLLLLVPVWWGVRAGRRAYHARFSALWIARVVGRDVTLAIRRSELRDDMAMLAGMPAAAGDAPYRGHALVPPPAFAARRKNPIPGWAFVLCGLVMPFAGVSQYLELGRAEAAHEVITRNAAVILIYDLGGRTAVLGAFVVAGIAFVAIGVAVLRAARTRR